MEVLVSEVRPRVASGAASFAAEHREPRFFEIAKRTLISGRIAVEARIPRPNGPHVACQRRRHPGDLEAGTMLHQGLGHAELLWIEDRLQRLLLQRLRASVPEERPPIAAIDDRWRAARAFLTVDAARDVAPIGEGELGIVA